MNAGSLNKGIDTTDFGGYSAPGGPTSTFPMYRPHRGMMSPKSTTPTSPFRGTYSPTGSSGMSVDAKLLINVPASELPEGVDPSQREVGLEKIAKCLIMNELVRRSNRY